jgi:hypothetical protein
MDQSTKSFTTSPLLMICRALNRMTVTRTGKWPLFGHDNKRENNPFSPKDWKADGANELKVVVVEHGNSTTLKRVFLEILNLKAHISL